MTNPPDEHTDKTTTVTPQLVSKDIEEFVDSGALINVLQANPLDYQGQKVICDTLHKYKMVKEGHTLEPVAGGTVQENYLRFYQQVSQGIKILVTLVAANHRINSGFKSMQNRIAKPNNGFGLCKPSDTSYLRNYQLTNWRHVSVGKDNEGAMVTTMEKVEQGEPTAFSSPVTVHIIVTRQNCSYRDLVNHLLARSEVIGTSNSENSTKSFGRIVNTAAMTQLGVGGVTRPLPSEVGSSQYYITGGVKKTATYFKLQVSDLSKGTETSDLIIKEAEPLSEGAEGFKAIDMTLLRKCPCPVWLHRPISKPRDKRRIAVAVDPMTTSPEQQALSRRLLELSRSIADTCDSRLHIISCWEHYLENYLDGNVWIQVEETQLASEVSLAKAKHIQALQRLIEESGIAGETVIHHLHGKPDDKIPECVDEIEIDVLVMGTLARTGISGFVIGNTAENILQSINCSLVALKPEGFVSPIK